MNDILFIVLLILILIFAVYLIYLYFKRKTDAKALRLMYLILFLGAIVNAVWLVVYKYFTITDSINDWIIYTESVFIILFFVVSFYGAARKKDKTPRQKELFKVAIISLSIALAAFIILLILIIS